MTDGQEKLYSADAWQRSLAEIFVTVGILAAVQLFVDGGKRVRPGYSVTRGNQESILEICRLVRGTTGRADRPATRQELAGMFQPQAAIRTPPC